MPPCPFCAIAAGAADAADADLIALRTPAVFVVPALKQRPRNRGHLLVLPVAHVTRLADADAALRDELTAVIGRVSGAVRAAFGATGTFVFVNEDAPDQVLDHLHVHVVPRTAGDGFRVPDPASEVLGRDERVRQAEAVRRALGG